MPAFLHGTTLVMKLGGVFLGLGLVGLAHAWPTSCCVIPIADILKHREVYGYFSFTGNERNIDRQTYYFNSLNVGLFDRIELGYDNDFLGATVYHAKLLLCEGTKTDYGVSVGYMNWSPADHYGEAYIVGRYGLPNGLRFHAGALQNDRWRVMAGVDYGIGNWTLAADWMSGPNNTLWTGATYDIACVPGLSVSGFVGFPSVKSDGIQHQFSVNFAFRF